METTEQRDLLARDLGNAAFGTALDETAQITRTPASGEPEPWMLAVTTDADDFRVLEQYVREPFRFRRYVGVHFRYTERRAVFAGTKDWLYILMRTVALDLQSARIDLRPATDVYPPVAYTGVTTAEKAEG